MSEQDFIKHASAAWQRVVAMQENPDTESSTVALAVSLWAAINADKLIEIASRKAQP